MQNRRTGELFSCICLSKHLSKQTQSSAGQTQLMACKEQGWCHGFEPRGLGYIYREHWFKVIIDKKFRCSHKQERIEESLLESLTIQMFVFIVHCKESFRTFGHNHQVYGLVIVSFAAIATYEAKNKIPCKQLHLDKQQ